MKTKMIVTDPKSAGKSTVSDIDIIPRTAIIVYFALPFGGGTFHNKNRWRSTTPTG
jgi:hypothetical protein